MRLLQLLSTAFDIVYALTVCIFQFEVTVLLSLMNIGLGICSVAPIFGYLLLGIAIYAPYTKVGFWLNRQMYNLNQIDVTRAEFSIISVVLIGGLSAASYCFSTLAYNMEPFPVHVVHTANEHLFYNWTRQQIHILPMGHPDHQQSVVLHESLVFGLKEKMKGLHNIPLGAERVPVQYLLHPPEYTIMFSQLKHPPYTDTNGVTFHFSRFTNNIPLTPAFYADELLFYRSLPEHVRDLTFFPHKCAWRVDHMVFLQSQGVSLAAIQNLDDQDLEQYTEKLEQKHLLKKKFFYTCSGVCGVAAVGLITRDIFF